MPCVRALCRSNKVRSMTKNELLEVQNFIKEMRQSPDDIDDIEVMNNIYVWIKQKYEEQGEKKLGEQYIKLRDI